MDALQRLDELLTKLHVARQQPAFRKRLLQGIDDLEGIGGLRVLRAIERNAQRYEGTTVGEVAVVLGISASATSRAVDEVVRRGLAEKVPCPKDLRRVRLSLTVKGSETLVQANRNRQNLLAAATAGWSQNDLGTLAQLLDNLLAGYQPLGASKDD